MFHLFVVLQVKFPLNYCLQTVTPRMSTVLLFWRFDPLSAGTVGLHFSDINPAGWIKKKGTVFQCKQFFFFFFKYSVRKTIPTPDAKEYLNVRGHPSTVNVYVQLYDFLSKE